MFPAIKVNTAAVQALYCTAELQLHTHPGLLPAFNCTPPRFYNYHILRLPSEDVFVSQIVIFSPLIKVSVSIQPHASRNKAIYLCTCILVYLCTVLVN